MRSPRSATPITPLDAIRASRDESQWCRVAATARLVRGRPELVPTLLELLRTLDYNANAQDTWNWIIDANAAAVDALGHAAATSPALRLRFVELMDDIRRERLKVPQGLVRDKASKVVREAVGSDMFADYERWRASQSA
jgi:hypothetical protein